MRHVIVTRHKALVAYIRERGIAPVDAVVIPHAGEADVRGAHVYGPLPLHLAALAAAVTEVPLRLPPELRGVELSLEEVRRLAGAPVTYSVARLDAPGLEAAAARALAATRAADADAPGMPDRDAYDACYWLGVEAANARGRYVDNFW